MYNKGIKGKSSLTGDHAISSLTQGKFNKVNYIYSLFNPLPPEFLFVSIFGIQSKKGSCRLINTAVKRFLPLIPSYFKIEILAKSTQQGTLGDDGLNIFASFHFLKSALNLNYINILDVLMKR